MQTGASQFACDAERQRRMTMAIRRLRHASRGIVSFDFLTAAEVDALILETASQSFRKASSEIVHRGRRVHQDFDVCFPAPRTGSFEQLAGLLEETVVHGCQKIDPYLLPAGLRFNDFAIQHYPANSLGIGIHRDGKRYRGLVVIVTLSGSSRLFSCADRDGSASRRIDDRPGRIVLLTASGFDGCEEEEARPLHGVDRIDGGRLSLGFRFEPSSV